MGIFISRLLPVGAALDRIPGGHRENELQICLM